MKKIRPFEIIMAGAGAVLIWSLLIFSPVHPAWSAIDTWGTTAITQSTKILGQTGMGKALGIAITSGAPSNFCSSCAPGDPADVFCEDWEGSEDIADGPSGIAQCTGWDNSEGAGKANLTSGIHNPVGDTLGCSGKGSNYIKIQYIDDAQIWLLKSITETNLYVKFYMYLNNTTGVDDGDYVIPFEIERADHAELITFYVKWTAATSNWQIKWYWLETGGQQNEYLANLMANNTWWEVTIVWESGAKAEIYINDGTATNSASKTANIVTADVVEISFICDGNQTAGEQIDILIDCISADDDTIPSDCAGTSP